jgi:hypothetical protein
LRRFGRRLVHVVEHRPIDLDAGSRLAQLLLGGDRQDASRQNDGNNGRTDNKFCFHDKADITPKRRPRTTALCGVDAANLVEN